jgi:hypothetical protein
MAILDEGDSNHSKNTRRNETGNAYNTAPLFFNPMSHVASNAQQSSQCGRILVGREIRVNDQREIKQKRWMLVEIYRLRMRPAFSF